MKDYYLITYVETQKKELTIGTEVVPVKHPIEWVLKYSSTKAFISSLKVPNELVDEVLAHYEKK